MPAVVMMGVAEVGFTVHAELAHDPIAAAVHGALGSALMTDLLVLVDIRPGRRR